MAKSRSKTSSKSGSGAGKIFLGFLLGVIAVVAAGAAYLYLGKPPVGTADQPLPFERELVHLPLSARIAAEKQTPPFGTSEDVYEGGAKVYRTQCASCHGTPGHDVAFARKMYPSAPQLWKQHARGGAVGVSDDSAGETYWKVANGIRLSGMPAYNHVLSDTEMWQVSQLLKNADQQLPDPVLRLLAGN